MGPFNMQSKKVSVQVKGAITSLKNTNKCMAKLTLHNLPKNKEFTGEFGNTKRPGRPWKVPKVDD